MADDDVIPEKLTPYVDAFTSAGEKYGFDPKVLMAIAMQENVAEGDRNPLGISDDSGPHHYGSQEEAEAAIDRQVAVMVSPSGPYRNVRSISDLAAIYSPVGASNDPYGTNATEASGIEANIAKLSGWNPAESPPTDPTDVDPATLSDKEFAEKYGGWLPQYPKPEEAPPEDRAVTPVDKLKEQFPTLSDEQLSSKLTDIFPKVAQDKIKTWAKVPGGLNLIKEEEEKDLTPLERYKRDNPEKAAQFKDDNQLIDWLHDNLDPKSDKDLFRDRVKPPNVLDTVIRDSVHNLQPSAMAALHQGSADYWGILAGDLERSIWGGVLGKDQLKQFEDWRDAQIKKMGGPGGTALTFLNDFVKYLHNNATEQRQAAAQEQAKVTPGLAGLPGQVVGQLAGSLPGAVTTFGAGDLKAVGVSTKSLMAWAMAKGSVSGYNKAYEENAKYPILEAAKSGAVDATAAWMFNSASGWVATGLGNILLHLDEDKIKAFFSGEKNQVYTAITSLAVDGILGASWSRAKEFPESALADLRAARELRADGEAGIERAKDLINRAFALSPPELTQSVVGDVIQITQKGAMSPAEMKARAAAIPSPISPRYLRSRASGLNKSVGVPFPDAGLYGYEGEYSNPYAAQAAKALGRQQTDKPAVAVSKRRAPRAAEPETAAPSILEQQEQKTKQFVDNVFFGVGHMPPERPAKGKLPGNRAELGAAIDPIEIIRSLIEFDRDLSWKHVPGLIGKGLRKIPGLEQSIEGGKGVFPEFQSAESMEAAAAIGRANVQMDFDTAQQQNELFRRHNFQAEMTHGDLAQRRSAYQKKYTYAQQLEMLFQAEEGKSTGDPTMDRMAEIRRIGYQMMDQAEQHLGMGHETRENYLTHLYEKADIEAFNKQYFGFNKPSFMNHREWKTYRQAFEVSKDQFGNPRFKPKTVDQEKIFQTRIMMHNRAKHIGATLRTWEREGKAFSTTDQELTVEQKSWPVVRSPIVDDGSFHVQPDVYNVMKNAWYPDRSGLNLAIGGWAAFGKALKAISVPLRIGDSIAHEIHLAPIRLGGRFSQMLSNPKGYTPREWMAAFAFDLPTVGIYGMIKDVRQRGSIVKLMKSERSMSTATEGERWIVSQLLDAGFFPGFSHEREIEMGRWLADNVRNGEKFYKAGTVADKSFSLAIGLASMQGMQRYMFGHVIPAVKTAQIIERIKDLYQKMPELLDPKNTKERLVALRSIQQKTDKRLGEMNFKNIFWPKVLKDSGIGAFLSLGWQMGLTDYIGGTLKSLTGNKFHMENVQNALIQRVGAMNRWDALRVGALYTVATMLEGAIANYLGTGEPPKDWRDYFNPRTGGKNLDGSPQRWRMLNFPSEIAAYVMDIQNQTDASPVVTTLKVAQHKSNPGINALFNAGFNTDYLGRFIRNPEDPALKQTVDTAGQLVQDLWAPMAGPAYEKLGRHLWEGRATFQDTKEAVAAFLGFNRGRKSSERSEIENKIMIQFDRESGHAKWVDDITKARSIYKQAVEDKDVKGQQAALGQMRQHGATEQQIKNLKEGVFESAPEAVFRHIKPPMQAKLLNEMSDQERKRFLPKASKKGREAFEKLKHMPIHPTGYHAPRNPREALTLGPGTKFMDPNGQLRVVPQNA